MSAAPAVGHDGERQWEQVDRNYGRRGGWLYSVIANKARGPILTGWLERYFAHE